MKDTDYNALNQLIIAIAGAVIRAGVVTAQEIDNEIGERIKLVLATGDMVKQWEDEQAVIDLMNTTRREILEKY